MRYKKPFTLDQRQDAVAAYRAFRTQIDAIRRIFRPRTTTEWAFARAFRAAVREFGYALKVKDAKVDVKRLNALHRRSMMLGISYAQLRNDKPLP
jgi:hypothetical protein